MNNLHSGVPFTAVIVATVECIGFLAYCDASDTME